MFSTLIAAITLHRRVFNLELTACKLFKNISDYTVCFEKYDLKTFVRLKAAKAEASSIYSQSAFRKLGFETLACYPYEDYCGKDSDGNNVFSGTGIHKTIDFMSRKIPCFKNTIL